jgi:hypothetical protein
LRDVQLTRILEQSEVESFLNQGSAMKSSLICMLILTGSAFARAQSTINQQKPNLRPDPVVMTQVDPASPLEITTRPRWFDEKTFEIYVVVKNISDKPITAYATTTYNLSAPHLNKVCSIHTLPVPGKILTKGKSDGKSQWNGTDSENKLPQLEFAVDFVEFMDGTIWGIDYCQAKENLDGYRAGLRTARALFRQILTDNGEEKLIAELNKGPLTIDSPSGHSDVWEKSFKSGIEGMRGSVLRAYQERGFPEIEIELNRPIGPSESAALKHW